MVTFVIFYTNTKQNIYPLAAQPLSFLNPLLPPYHSFFHPTFITDFCFNFHFLLFQVFTWSKSPQPVA